MLALNAHLAGTKSGVALVTCTVNTHANGLLHTLNFNVIFERQGFDIDGKAFSQLLRAVRLYLRTHNLLCLTFLWFRRNNWLFNLFGLGLLGGTGNWSALK
jgi:hypothetical protein